MPETRKIAQILRTVVKNQGFAVFNSSRLRSSIGDPLGLYFWEPFGFQVAPTWLPEFPRQLQDDPGSLQDVSYTPPGPPKDFPRRLQDRPQRAQDTPKALQQPPRRLCEPPRCLQDVSKSSPEQVFETQAASKSSPGEPSKPPVFWRRCAVSKRSLAMDWWDRVWNGGCRAAYTITLHHAHWMFKSSATPVWSQSCSRAPSGDSP